MAETPDKSSPPPYVSKKTYDSIMGGFKVGVPGQIDRSLFRTYSGSAQTAILHALRSLKLIDVHGTPTTLLHRIVKADGHDAKDIHREIIRAGYPFLFRDGFNLLTATPRMLEQKFAEAGAQGDTVRKCIAFFVLYAKDAELQLSPHLKKPIVRAARAPGSRKTRTAGKGDKTQTPPPPPPPGDIKSVSEILLELLSDEMKAEEQNAVWTLLKYVKRIKR